MALLCGSEVPQEIVDTIIDYHSDDNKTLQACSLVCRTFTPCSQQHLFRHLYIDYIRVPNTERANADYFNGLKDISGHLERVESLFIRIPQVRFGMNILIDTLGRMVNLKKVHMECFGHSPDDLKLMPYCCTPTIKHIYLTHAFPVSLPFLEQCVSLEQLSFNATEPRIAVDDHVDVSSNPEIAESLKQVMLKSLFICAMQHDNIDNWLEDPRCPVSIRNLVALAIVADKEWDFDRFVTRFIPTCFQQLQVLALQPSLHISRTFSEFENPTTPLNLALLPQLTCLIFSFREPTSYRNTHLAWVISHLSQLRTENKLEELQMWIGTDAKDDCEHLDEWGQCWEKLDRALSEPKFDGLQNVYIDFSKTRSLGSFISRFHEFMPSTRERKSLYVIELLPDQVMYRRDRLPEYRILNESFQERLALIRTVCKGSKRL